jgi:hypothetical protein
MAAGLTVFSTPCPSSYFFLSNSLPADLFPHALSNMDNMKPEKKKKMKKGNIFFIIYNKIKQEK